MIKIIKGTDFTSNVAIVEGLNQYHAYIINKFATAIKVAQKGYDWTDIATATEGYKTIEAGEGAYFLNCIKGFEIYSESATSETGYIQCEGTDDTHINFRKCKRGGDSSSTGFTIENENGLAVVRFPSTITIPEGITEVNEQLGLNAFGSLASSTATRHDEITQIKFPSTLTTISSLAYLTGVTSLDIPSSVTYLGGAGVQFNGMTSLKTVKFNSLLSRGWRNSTSANYSSPFYGCLALEEIIVPEGWNISLFISSTTATWHSQNLTVTGLVNLFNNLYDFTGGTAHTLTIGATNLAKLSAEQLAIATNKNWTVS